MAQSHQSTITENIFQCIY